MRRISIPLRRERERLNREFSEHLLAGKGFREEEMVEARAKYESVHREHLRISPQMQLDILPADK